jgi:multiple sugar transport system substrate-binding protein
MTVKKMRMLSMMLAIVLTISIAVGCSDQNNNAGGSSNDQNTTPSANDQANEPADNNDNTSSEKKLEGKLTIWTFFGQVEDMGKKFEEKHPDVDVEVKVFPGDQYQTKLLTALQSGKDAPDIFDLERGYIGKFINSNFVTDLSAMGAEDLVKDYVPYVQELGRGNDGKLYGISDHSSPGGFWYIKENAKKWLGTDDPAEIGAMVDSWDKVIELGKKISADSGGKVHLISHFGDVSNVEAYHMDPWVVDGKLNIDSRWEEVYEVQKQIRSNNVDAKLEFFSAGWGNAINDGSVVLNALPAWAGFMIDNKDGKAVGKFGVASTPKGFYMGGTYRTIYSKSPNKELAYEFVKYIASPEWQAYNLGATGNMPGSLKVYEENLESFKASFFGEQNILKPYYAMMKEVPPLKADKYGEEVLGKWRKVSGEGLENSVSFNDVVVNFKKEVGNAFPEIKMD